MTNTQKYFGVGGLWIVTVEMSLVGCFALLIDDVNTKVEPEPLHVRFSLL